MLRAISLLTLASCVNTPAPSPTPFAAERTVLTMGTSLRVHATGDGAHDGVETAIQAVLAADRRWSSWREDSQLRRLHGTPVGVETPVDAAFRRGLALAMAWSKRTDGAFDPTIGRILDQWRSAPPAPADLARARAASGLQHFRIHDASVERTGDARLAEGGFAKGLALDTAIAAARRCGIASIELDLGGQLAWWNTTNPPRPIGIADPDRRRTAVAWVDPPLAGSLASSGTSERGAHILDPRTGRPARDWGTVTVLCTGPDAACSADCLSTALFVLGPSVGLGLARRLPHVEALFLERTSRGLHSHATPGMRARLRTQLTPVHITTKNQACDSSH